MNSHFRAFSFVDRITSLEAGSRIQGYYHIPPGIPEFPVALATEAVGQLAAWASMSHLDFVCRPLAGIAGLIEIAGTPRPGQRLELSAELESIDTENVAYHGSANVDGSLVVHLRDCIGPMMRIENFDDPEAVRNRFQLLLGEGAQPAAFGGLPQLSIERTGGEPGRSVDANLVVPTSHSLFEDHFPRRPLFPGTLLMHGNLELLQMLCREIPLPAGATAWTVHAVSNVKLRAFISPGETLLLHAALTEQLDERARFAIEVRCGRRVVGRAEAESIAETVP